ncbi:MAG: hypothetical protein A3F18_01430 [Legionellales bacterium RIFCSPHIGHO2_12_FULL_37_14]|nr:MAG: hypothetical protein A3F18_01430 [Legionellales bacterium RIFCSPHIGHO2_12_FULL_37_14]
MGKEISEQENNILTENIATLRRHMSPVVLFDLGLIDQNTKAKNLTFPLIISQDDAPFIVSIKAYLNCLYHFTEEGRALDELNEAKNAEWLKNIKMLLPILSLLGNVNRQYHSGEDFIHHISSLVKSNKQNLNAEFISSNSFHEEAMQKVQYFASLVSGAETMVDKAEIIKKYKIFLHNDCIKYLNYLSLLEARHGLNRDTITKQYLQELEKVHAVMSSKFKDDIGSNLQDEIATDVACARAKSISSIKAQYIEKKVKENELEDLIKWLSLHESSTLTSLSANELQTLRSIYLPLRSYFAAYASEYDQIILKAIAIPPQKDLTTRKSCQYFIEPLRMLQQNCKEAAQENLFIYKSLNHTITIDTFKLQEEIKQQKMQQLLKPDLMLASDVGTFEDDLSRLNRNRLAIKEAEKIATLRYKIEQSLPHAIGNDVLLQLGFSPENPNIKLPIKVSKHDYPHTKCIKTLLNSMHHAELGIRFYVKSHTTNGFFGWLLKFYYLIRSKAQIKKTIKYINEFKDKSSLVLHGQLADRSLFGNVMDINQYQCFAESSLANIHTFMQGFFVDTFSMYSMYDKENLVNEVLTKFSVNLAKLDRIDTKSREFQQTVLKEFSETIANIDTITRNLATGREQNAALSAIKKFHTILTKMLLNNGVFNAALANDMQIWINTHLIEIINCTDRMEEQYGLKHGVISSNIEQSVNKLIAQAENNGQKLVISEDFYNTRINKTKDAIYYYVKQYENYASLKYKAHKFFSLLNKYKNVDLSLITDDERALLLNSYQDVALIVERVFPKLHARFINDVTASLKPADDFNCLADLLAIKTTVFENINDCKLACKMKLDIAMNALRQLMATSNKHSFFQNKTPEKPQLVHKKRLE